MVTTYKKILVLQSFNEAVAKLNYNPEDYLVVGKFNKLVKKLQPQIEEFQEAVEDLRLDHCMKDGQKIIRENGQLQWTAEGEKAFRKAYKALLEQEVELNDVTPLNYKDILNLLPSNSGAATWDDVRENLSPFFEYQS